METNQKGDKNKISGVLFVGCMFIGMGIGMLTGHQTVGMFIGMGVGFLGAALYRTRSN